MTEQGFEGKAVVTINDAGTSCIPWPHLRSRSQFPADGKVPGEALTSEAGKLLAANTEGHDLDLGVEKETVQKC